MRSYRRRLGIVILFLSDLAILFFIAVLAIFIRTFLPSIISGFPALSIKINYSWWFFPIWISILTYEGAYNAGQNHSKALIPKDFPKSGDLNRML